MKILGRKIEGPNVEEIVIPRGLTQIVLLATAVLDDTEFTTLCPQPKAKILMVKGGKKVEQTNETGYRASMELWARQRIAWLVVKSLEATEGLEWETVNYERPETWVNYETELKSSGFSEAEIARVIMGVMAANGLSETKVEEARQRFLALREAESDEPLSLVVGQPTTPSGVPASV